jgi:plastocyanin
MHALGLALQLGILLCALLAASCAEERATTREQHTEDDPVRALTGYEPSDVVNGGSISGRANWVGPPPEPIQIPVTVHSEWCGAVQPSPTFVMGRRNALAGTVVWLDGIHQGRAVDVATPAHVEATRCAFAPHVLAVGVGTTLEVRSRDSFLHNVHASFVESARRFTTWFSSALPTEGSSFTRVVERRGVTRWVDDAAHPWMLGWVHAFEHPYFAVTDADGRFQIANIPAGQYTLRAWHEGVLSSRTESGRPVYSAPILLARPITITGGTDSALDVSFSLEAARAAGE